MRKPTVVSLFTGAGGLDLGFHAAGLRTAVAVEMDEDCCRTLEANRGKEHSWTVMGKRVEDVSAEELLQAARLGVGEADVLIGGPPCQPFSKSGYWASGDSQRLDDPRANTLAHYLRILRDTQPKAFLLENVAGLRFSQKDEGLRYFDRQLRAINKTIGTRYSLACKVLNSSAFGVPQLRERIFLVGHRDGRTFEFPEPRFADHHKAKCESGLPPVRTAWDALGDLEQPWDVNEAAVRGKFADLLPTIPEGANYLFHTDRGCEHFSDHGRPVHGRGARLFGWRRRYWSFLLKLSKWRPSWTLCAQPGPAIGPFHWDSRRLARRELARLQTLPDHYQLTGSLNAVQKQLGNAVPSLLAEVLALEIRRQLLSHRVSSASPRLLRDRCTLPPPKPMFDRHVPAKYRELNEDLSAHPGTGGGHRAIARNQLTLPLARHPQVDRSLAR